MSKRNFLKLALSVPYVFYCGRYISGCRPRDHQSDLDFLNMNSRFILAGPTFNPERVATVEQMFSGIIRNASAANMKQTLEQMSLLPDRYLVFLKQQADRGYTISFESPIAGYAAGVAGLAKGGMYGSRPRWIKLRHDAPRSGYVVLHELGHSLHSFAETVKGLPPSASTLLSKTYSEVQNSPEVRRIWSYAMTNPVELFAVGFSSFYYSEAHREDMQRSFPVASRYFNEILLPPPGASDGAIQENNGEQATNPLISAPGQQVTEGGNNNLESIPGMNNQNMQPNGDPLIQLIEFFANHFNQQNAMLRMRLTGDELINPQMVMPTTGMDFFQGETAHIELRPGLKDFHDNHLEGYRVFLSVTGQENDAEHELPGAFSHQPMIADDNILAAVKIPDIEELAKLYHASPKHDALNVKQLSVQLRIKDPNNVVLDTSQHILKELHVEERLDKS